MTALDHLIAALVDLERQMQDIEHRQSFIRSAIEAFGVDADDALLVAVKADEQSNESSHPLDCATCNEGPTTDDDRSDVIEQTNQIGRLPNGRWNWQVVGEEIELADVLGKRRISHLMDTFDVNAATAQWLVKRCREQSLIDIERPPFDAQAARDRAAAAL